jgi:type I restriction enzyme S subunit
MKTYKEWQTGTLIDYVEINLKSLGSSTPSDYQFLYIDLSSVNKGVINLPSETISFAHAPSRARRMFSKGDILFGTVRPYLQSHAYVDFEPINIIASTGFAVISPRQFIDGSYLYHYLFSESINKQIYALLVGSNYPAITSTDVGNLIISVPPLDEQSMIAQILSTWDEAIDLQNKLIIEKKNFLSSLALSLVKNHKSLVKFESLWKTVSLSDVFIERKEYGYEDEDLELYSLTIEDGVTTKTDRYNREFLVKGDRKKYKVTKQNDLVFNPQNLRYGAIALNNNEKPVLLSPIYATLEFKDTNKYDIEYFNFLLTSNEMIKFYDSIAEGTLVERMTVKPEVFLKQEFSIPPVEEQRRISQVLIGLRDEIILLENEVKLKKLQKQGLMQQLLTGKVRVNIN